MTGVGMITIPDLPLAIGFGVAGLPQPAGSKRAFPFVRPGFRFGARGSLGVRVVDDNPKSIDWKKRIARVARARYRGEPLDGPLLVKFLFRLPRPKGHFRTGRNAHLLRDNAPEFPGVKPDVLKLARGAEDALTGIVWSDDAQIVKEILEKVYVLQGQSPAVFISVYFLSRSLFR